ncbi:hypothetical protein DN820_22230, partial [Stutzerimonas nosocomialis]
MDKANRELVELYLQLDLPKLWGDGKAVAADGTQFDFYAALALRSIQCSRSRLRYWWNLV